MLVFMFTILKIHLFCICFGSRIREEKEKDYPKSIPLKIIAKDVGTCAYVSALELIWGYKSTSSVNPVLVRGGRVLWGYGLL